MEHRQKGLRKTHVRFIVLAATALLLMTASSSVWAETQSIVGDPLECTVMIRAKWPCGFEGVAQYYGDGVGVMASMTGVLCSCSTMGGSPRSTPTRNTRVMIPIM